MSDFIGKIREMIGKIGNFVDEILWQDYIMEEDICQVPCKSSS